MNMNRSIITITHPVVAIHIAQQYPYVENAHDLYMCTRGLWRVNVQRAALAKYGFAVYQAEIVEVYEIEGWEPVSQEADRYWRERCAKQGRSLPKDLNKGRSQFIGKVAPAEVRDMYIGKLLPIPHVRNPIRYFNC